MRALDLHRFLLRFALGFASVFAWLFFFQFFSITRGSVEAALSQVALLYALSAVTTLLLTPWAARALRAGARRALLFGTLFVLIAYVGSGSIFEGFWGLQTSAAIVCFALALGIYRALYWVPYAVESSAEGPRRRGRAVEVATALAPAAGGIFVAAVPAAPLWLFYVAALLVGLSLVPLFSPQETYEDFSWSYRRTFHEFLSPEHRRVVGAAFWEGVSGAALLLFWPLAVFLILGWSYGVLGVVLSLTFLAAIFLRAPVRALLRRGGLQRSRLVTTVFALTPWLFRMTVASPFGIVLVDSYFYTTTPRRMGVDPFAFEQSGDGGSLLDEYTALKEMAQSAGRAACCILGACAALILSAPLAFALVFSIAAISSAMLAFRNS